MVTFTRGKPSEPIITYVSSFLRHEMLSNDQMYEHLIKLFVMSFRVPDKDSCKQFPFLEFRFDL